MFKLIIRKTQNNTEVSLIYQTGTNFKVWQHILSGRLWGNSYSHTLLGESKQVQPFCRGTGIRQHLTELLCTSPSEPAIPFWGLYLQQLIAPSFIVVKYYKPPKCSYIGDWLNKLQSIHTMEDIKKDEDKLHELICSDFLDSLLSEES